MNQKVILTILVVVLLAASAIYYATTQKEQNIQESIKETSIDSEDSETVPVDEADSISITSDVEDMGVEVDITSWKIYRNEEYGFEFNYPNEYVLEDDYELAYSYRVIINLNRESDIELYKNYGDRGGGPPNISVIVHSNPDKLTALEWAKKNRGYSNFLDESSEILVAGQGAISYPWEGHGGGDTIILQNINGDYIIKFGTISNNQGVEVKEDFLGIVSTFKFIK